MFTKADIEKYFVAEKQESLVFLIIGIVALLTAAGLLTFAKSPYFKGAAIPLIVIGLIQVSVGYTIFKRSDADRSRNVYAYDMNPTELKDKELPRMQKVNNNFIIIRWVEMALATAGIFILFYYSTDASKVFLAGVGLTLTIQAIIMLGADYFAEKRAKIYTAGIETFISEKKL